MNGPPLYDVSSSRPAGSPSVLSRRPSRLRGRGEVRGEPVETAADGVRRSRRRRRSPTPSSSRPSSGRTATACRPGGRCAWSRPSASRALAVTVAPGHSRSTAVSAVMIFAVLAGCTGRVDAVADQDLAGSGVDDDVGLRVTGARRPRRSPTRGVSVRRRSWRPRRSPRRRTRRSGGGGAWASRLGGTGVARSGSRGRFTATVTGNGSGPRPRDVPPWGRGHLLISHLGPHRRHPGIGDARRRRQGQGAEGGGRERHRLRGRGARLPDPRARRRGRDRGVPRPPLPPLLADAGPARAARGDRVQDQARLRRRLRRGAGRRHQRRQARRLQHVPGAL